MNEEKVLHEIRYRLEAVDTLRVALELRSKWIKAPPMTMHVDGRQVIEGNLNGFTNLAIEAGIIHCRALLEFLGLCRRNNKLGNVTKRLPGDIGVENFSNANGPLKKVDPEAALSRYKGGREEAEKALLAIFHIANKRLAHITGDWVDDPEHGRLVEVAVYGIPALVISYLYTPLGLPSPIYKTTSRPGDT
jgi:hypothetical protein